MSTAHNQHNRTTLIAKCQEAYIMNEKALSALTNACPATRGNPCGSPGRSAAADSLLSLLRTTPRVTHCPLSLAHTTNLCCAKRSSPPLVVVPSLECGHQVKRQKRVSSTNDVKKHTRVTFATQADHFVTYITCQPYVQGLTDGECLRFYRNDIWYTVRFHDCECF